jgi:hypothetical protein
LFLKSYYVAQVLFAVGVVVLAKKTRSTALYVCALGFVLLVGGNALMVASENEMLEMLQAHDDAGSMQARYLVGRGISSMGYLISSISLLAYSINPKLARRE